MLNRGFLIIKADTFPWLVFGAYSDIAYCLHNNPLSSLFSVRVAYPVRMC